MSDGREERDEREKRRELDRKQDGEDRLEQPAKDEWEPERKES